MPARPPPPGAVRSGQPRGVARRDPSRAEDGGVDAGAEVGLAEIGRSYADFVADYRPELAHGVFHTAEGWVIFMVALVMLVLFHQAVTVVVRMIRARQ